MRRFFTLAILIIISFLLQFVVFPGHSLEASSPNFLLILTMSFGIMRGRKEGLLVGFFSGFLCDIFWGTLIGPYMLLYMIIGYLNGLFHRNYLMEDVLLPVIIISIDSFISEMMIFIFSFLLRNRLEFGSYFIKMILPNMLCTMVFTVIVYRIYVTINKYLKEKVKRKRA